METTTARNKKMFTTDLTADLSTLFKELGYDWEEMEIGEFLDVSQKGYQILGKDGQWKNLIQIVRKDDEFAYNIITKENKLEVAKFHKLFVKSISSNIEEFKEVIELITDYSNYLVFEEDNWTNFKVEQTNNIIPIVDIQIDDDHAYYTNNILSHNTFMSDPKTTPGGNAMKFYASVRLRLLGKKMIEIDEQVTKSKVSIGAHVTVRTDKCKLGPPKRAIDFQLLFTEGIYEYDEWITYLENMEYIQKGGGWYTFQPTFPLKSYVGQKFQKNSFEETLADEEVLNTIKSLIIKAFIRPTNDAQLKLEQAQAESIIE